MNFDEWWNEDYDDKDNPFEKDSFGYWAYAGWCAAMQVEKRDNLLEVAKEIVSNAEEYDFDDGLGVGISMDLYSRLVSEVEAKLKEKNICR